MILVNPQTYCRWALYREISSMSTTYTDDRTSQQVDSIRPTGWSPPTGASMVLWSHDPMVWSCDLQSACSCTYCMPTGRPAPQGMEPDIPFRVRRSRFCQLPVYTDYKSGRTRILTKISKIDGDIIVSYHHPNIASMLIFPPPPPPRKWRRCFETI